MDGMASADRLVYRPVLGRVLTVCFALFVLWWAVAGITSPHHAGLSWTALAWVLVIGAVLYALFWRPAVVVEPDGVQLINVVRDVRVPWVALEGVRTQYALTLVTARRSYPSWAAGAPGRRNSFARTGSGRGGGVRTMSTPRDAAGATGGAGGAGTTAHHLPGEGWLPGGDQPDRSSRDLRTDSGAAAFMVEQAWLGWRDRSRPAAGPEDAVPAVIVRWNLPVAIGVPALLAFALLAGALNL